MRDSQSQVHDHKKEAPTKLRRGIRGWQVGFIALGGIIGSGYFLGTGYAYNEMGPGIIFAYLLVGFIVFGLMIAYAELLVNLPRSGSFISYSKEFLGDPVSAGIGWSYWANWAAYVPAECLAVGIMLNVFLPGNIFVYSVITLTLLTFIQLAGVNWFAKIESGLSMTKVFAIIVFIIIAAGVWLGIWGNADGFVGGKVVFADASETLKEQLFPYGIGIVFILLVSVLVNFQGTEIIGMTAAETDHPEIAIPRACKAVVVRVALIFIIPITFLILLFPHEEAGLDDSVFAVVLKSYGMDAVAWIFSAIVIVAAFSCANTGMYATSRVVYSLALEGLAPKGLAKLNKNAVPKNAVLFTVAPMWVVVIIGYLLPDSAFYAYLLNIAGFTGTTCWMGIIGSQLVFRHKLKKRGYDVSYLKVRVKHMWIPIVSICAQTFGLASLMADKAMWPVFGISLGCFLVPAIMVYIAQKMGKARVDPELPDEEQRFDEKYPEIVNK
ncbi:MAG: amino acid permease [Anaerovoracaceae bacterium]|jgi:AAT family amino acid transporter